MSVTGYFGLRQDGCVYLRAVSQFESRLDVRANQSVDEHELPFVLHIDGAAVRVEAGAVPGRQRSADEVLLEY